MKRYTVAQVGAGKRGKIHLDGFSKIPDRFELLALCDLDEQKMQEAAQRFGVPATFTDAEEMLAEVKPDVFCFVTQPDLRLPMVELGARHGVKAIAFEKPMARSLAEARAIVRTCEGAGIKAVVCHQQKYVSSFRAIKRLVDAGEIGTVVRLHAEMRGGFLGIATHFMDYMLWMNGGARAEWVTGHVHGNKRAPDYVLGQMRFENGARGGIECGYLSAGHVDPVWLDCRLTVYGTHGYAWAETDGLWQAFTRSSGGEILREQGIHWIEQERDLIQEPYLRDLAAWLDDDAAVHPCNLDISYHGFEILEGLCRSAIENTRIDLPLPLQAAGDAFEKLRSTLQEVPPREPAALRRY